MDRPTIDWIDKVVFVLALPIVIVGGICYGLLVLYWLIRGKDWDRFPLP